ncbi:hypothetical protein BGZ74_004680, partial [Mortierella antarctica]
MAQRDEASWACSDLLFLGGKTYAHHYYPFLPPAKAAPCGGQRTVTIEFMPAREIRRYEDNKIPSWPSSNP